MITKNDCLILLKELELNNVDVKEILRSLINNPSDISNVIKFINDHREIDLSKFYTKLRKSYNNKKSNLYINIVKEIEDVNDVLTTLASLQLQILLFSKNVEDKYMFLRHARIDEINKVLSIYYSSYNLTPCLKLLRIIKSDIKVLECMQK